MIIINRLLRVFANSDDEDLAAEENFQISFSNVVNFLLLVYSLVSGMHALFIENIAMAVSNIVFCFLFITHFFTIYLAKRNPTLTAMNRMVIFVHFIMAYINSSVLGSAGIVMIIYPFIAIILHGRRQGIILSLMQMTVCITYTALCIYKVLPIPFNYAPMELFVIFSVQIVSLFTYYVAIRWLSSLIYDHITEVGQLNEALGIKTELISTVTGRLKSQLTDIYNLADHMSHERMNPRQMELVATMKASAANLLNSVDIISAASDQNIQPIQNEEVSFNVFNLISNVLVLYGADGGMRHSVSVSSEVPQNVMGNSQLTRQIFLTSFDSLDRKFGLAKTPMRVSVSMNDVSSERMMLNFKIESDMEVHMDHRDLSSSESRLMYQLQLDATQRLVQSAGGDFFLELTDDEKLNIEFILPFRDIIHEKDHKEEDLNIDIAALMPEIKMEDARLLIIDDDDETVEEITNALKDKVHKIQTAENSQTGLKMFENSRYDMIIVEIDSTTVKGKEFIRKARDMEAGYGAGVPIFATTHTSGEDIMRDTTTKIDGIIKKPIDTEKIAQTIKEAFELTNQ